MSSHVKGRVYSSFKACEIHRMPPTCCRCNASGRCKNCSCKKSKKVCSKCQPSRLGKCANVQQPKARTDGQATAMTLPTGNHTDRIMPDAMPPVHGKHVNIQIEAANEKPLESSVTAVKLDSAATPTFGEEITTTTIQSYRISRRNRSDKQQQQQL